MKRGYYYLSSKLSSNFVIDVAAAQTANGTKLQLYRLNQTPAQKFRFNVVEPALQDGTYTFSNIKSSFNLEAQGEGVASGTNVCQGTPSKLSSQLFTATYDATYGYYSITATSSGLALDISGNNVCLNIPSAATTQKYHLVPIEGSTDTYTLYNASSGKVIEVEGGSVANGANVVQYAPNNTSAQQWKATTADPSQYTTWIKLAGSSLYDTMAATVQRGWSQNGVWEAVARWCLR